MRLRRLGLSRCDTLSGALATPGRQQRWHLRHPRRERWRPRAIMRELCCRQPDGPQRRSQRPMRKVGYLAMPIPALAGRSAVRAGQRRWPVLGVRSLSDNVEQCRRLRHHPGNAGGFEQLCAELCERRLDRHPARAHGDGQCEEPGLWRCQPRTDLSGRYRTGQRRPRWRRSATGSGQYRARLHIGQGTLGGRPATTR